MKRNESGQEGQSLVLVAIALVGLVIFVAISVDVSSAYYYRRTAQNAADGASLAAVRRMAFQINQDAFDDTAIKLELNDFGERNGSGDTGGVPGDEINAHVEGVYIDEEGNPISGAGVGGGSVPADAWGVEATVYMTAPTFLGGIVGFDGYPVQAVAASRLVIACGEECVLPIATHVDALNYPEGQCLEMWNGTDPGNFGWVNWELQPDANHCGGDAGCVAENLTPGGCNSGFIAVGDHVDSTTGVKNSSNIRNALDAWLEPGMEFTTIVWNETFDTGTNVHYVVAGFARWELLAYQLSGGLSYPVDPIPDEWGCEPLSAGDPEDKNRIWARYKHYTAGAGGTCKAVGTVYAPTITK